MLQKISALFETKWHKMSSGSGQGAIPVPGPVVAQSVDAWAQNMSVIYTFNYSLPANVTFLFYSFLSFLY